MKIVFIDIDGVLNYHNSARIDSRCLALAKRISQETGAKFVLSSSWRESVLFPDQCSEHDNRFIDNLMHNSDLPFLGVTPYIDEDRRELEVQAWLDSSGVPVEGFVILDDLDFGFPDRFPENFVKTSGFSKAGLTEENVANAIWILEKLTNNLH